MDSDAAKYLQEYKRKRRRGNVIIFLILASFVLLLVRLGSQSEAKTADIAVVKATDSTAMAESKLTDTGTEFIPGLMPVDVYLNLSYKFYFKLIEKRSRKIREDEESITKQAEKVWRALTRITKHFAQTQ